MYYVRYDHGAVGDMLSGLSPRRPEQIGQEMV